MAATVAQGVHGLHRPGQGEQFWQFRRYQPGDPAATIDWRQTAKRERAYIRQHEWTAAQTVSLWCAGGPGMAWRSAARLPTKLERAHLLAIALTSLLLRGGERVGLLDPVDPPGTSRAALHRLAEGLRRAPGTEPPAAAVPRHATVVLIGDFLDPLDSILPAIRALAARGARGHLLQILDPAEESLPYRGRVRFTDVGGSGDAWLVSRAEDVRLDYVARLAAHRERLTETLRGYGWTFARHHTDAPPEPPLLALYQALAQRGPQRGGGW